MKKELESFFLDMDDKEIYLNLVNGLKKISNNDEFYRKIENKYVMNEFEILKAKNSLYKIEDLVENFPNNENSKFIQRYHDSIWVSKAKTNSELIRLLTKYPDIEFKNEIVEKIRKANEKNKDFYMNRSSDKRILITDETDTEENAVKILTERYNNYYTSVKAHSKFYYMELTDEEIKRLHFKNKFLIYVREDGYDNYGHKKVRRCGCRRNYPGTRPTLRPACRMCCRQKNGVSSTHPLRGPQLRALRER